MFSAEESTQSSYAMRSRASSVCITAIAASKYLMYSAWLGQSSGATMESPLLPASSSAVEERRELDRGRAQLADPLRHRVYRDAGVDDVLDQNHVATDERTFDHVGEPQAPVARRPGRIAGSPHELELSRDAQAAQQVG